MTAGPNDPSRKRTATSVHGPVNSRRVEEIFKAALTMEASQRAAFIDEACGSDRALIAEVQSLLDADDAADGFLNPPTNAAAFAPGDRSDRAMVGGRIGQYRIDRLIASGGMGTVYEATQDRPRRTVALKVIKTGFVSPAMLRRFEHEVEILGRLRHPNIAQIFDAGSHASDGHVVPYFAMEYLPDALDIVSYADRNKLDMAARVELLAGVCDAVHYAHQQGVIHRDLKPGNILVDSAGEAKVLDFGVARLTDADVRTTTLQTDMGQLVGTLPYMSPEQCVGDPRDLDIRSDVYALGVCTYKLFAGQLPYDVNGKSVYEAVRVIREEDPIPLSTVAKRFRGDLTTIVAKSLEKDRGRRYASAHDLADDLRRFLRHDPLKARPPSTVYQLRKFARRHQMLVGVVLAAFVSLSFGTVLAIGQAIRATAARDEAESVVAFLESALKEANLNAGGPDVRVRDLLDQAARTVEAEFGDRPLVEARLRCVIGVSFQSLGLYEDAEGHVQRAFEIYKRELGLSHRRTIDAMNELAPLAFWQREFDEGVPRAQEALAIARREFGSEDLLTLNALENLSGLLIGDDKPSEAEPLLLELVQTTQRLRGEAHSETLDRRNHLARLRRAQGRLDEAEALLRQILASARMQLGVDHQKTLSYQLYLAEVLHEKGDWAASEDLYRATLESGRELWGSGHLKTLRVMNGLAQVLGDRGGLSDAESILREAVEQAEQSYPKDFWYMTVLHERLGSCLVTQEKYQEAEPLLIRCLERAQASRRLSADFEKHVARSLVVIYEATGRHRRATALRASTLERLCGR